MMTKHLSNESRILSLNLCIHKNISISIICSPSIYAFISNINNSHLFVSFPYQFIYLSSFLKSTKREKIMQTQNVSIPVHILIYTHLILFLAHNAINKTSIRDWLQKVQVQSSSRAFENL